MDVDALHAALAIETGIHEMTVWRYLAGSQNMRAGNRLALAAARERIEREHAEGLGRAVNCPRCPHEGEP